MIFTQHALFTLNLALDKKAQTSKLASKQWTLSLSSSPTYSHVSYFFVVIVFRYHVGVSSLPVFVGKSVVQFMLCQSVCQAVGCASTTTAAVLILSVILYITMLITGICEAHMIVFTRYIRRERHAQGINWNSTHWFVYGTR